MRSTPSLSETSAFPFVSKSNRRIKRLQPFLLTTCCVASLLSTAAAETYATWCANHFTPAEIQAGLAVATADADSDGVPNLLEYFGGNDPRDPASIYQLQVSYDSLLGQGLVTVVAPQDREDIEYEIELSNDLITWETTAIWISGPNPDVWSMNGNENGKRFARLRVREKAVLPTDSDGDGLSDAWEMLYFGGLDVAVPSAIGSADGLTNSEKDDLGLDPSIDYTSAQESSVAQYTYDPVGRLTSVTAPVAAATFTPDEEGNILNAQ